jgi:hypothetical protein
MKITVFTFIVFLVPSLYQNSHADEHPAMPDCNKLPVNYSISYLDENTDGVISLQEYLQGDPTHQKKPLSTWMPTMTACWMWPNKKKLSKCINCCISNTRMAATKLEAILKQPSNTACLKQAVFFYNKRFKAKAVRDCPVQSRYWPGY